MIDGKNYLRAFPKSEKANKRLLIFFSLLFIPLSIAHIDSAVAYQWGERYDATIISLERKTHSAYRVRYVTYDVAYNYEEKSGNSKIGYESIRTLEEAISLDRTTIKIAVSPITGSSSAISKKNFFINTLFVVGSLFTYGFFFGTIMKVIKYHRENDEKASKKITT